MWNLFKKPIEKSSFEAWSKMSDDIAKVAILAIPVIIYGAGTILSKTMDILLLLSLIYIFLAMGRIFRKKFKEIAL
ncbi:hypothetical protein QJU43_04680 [Pasteurella atlantica]|uniref:Uncharacterized protein n=2 Tax=Pasteurellaceae TaxID=712 RepID=A0ACC6HKL1_9PAST|nr:hypothetical protein [Pasteurella atlantica]MDP8033579.1 hypothetical protein [Pasteurella atlantica]MDP8035641.1 hypothetical protein [Pasteurella atlantica]MDP8037592.1 hypothetical protein [Pasteurella atlantica]MDP8047941.1 hypothetical protein [Pasteurella atlantica]MDP8049896.1 hypothetical protein [Pasteurella atlantica]